MIIVAETVKRQQKVDEEPKFVTHAPGADRKAAEIPLSGPGEQAANKLKKKL